jgi:hypothetical protein
METRRFTGRGTEVRPGARERHLTNQDKLSFTFWLVCDSVDPEAWHGEAKVGSTTVLITEAAADEVAASRMVEKAFEAKVAALFGGSTT